MTFNSAYLFIYSYLVSHQLIALGILIALAIFLWSKPAVFFKFTLAILCIIAVVYFGSLLGESGQSGVIIKNKMINKSALEMSN
jgi:hypothetical protein